MLPADGPGKVTPLTEQYQVTSPDDIRRDLYPRILKAIENLSVEIGDMDGLCALLDEDAAPDKWAWDLFGHLYKVEIEVCKAHPWLWERFVDQFHSAHRNEWLEMNPGLEEGW